MKEEMKMTEQMDLMGQLVLDHAEVLEALEALLMEGIMIHLMVVLVEQVEMDHLVQMEYKLHQVYLVDFIILQAGLMVQ